MQGAILNNNQPEKVGGTCGRSAAEGGDDTTMATTTNNEKDKKEKTTINYTGDYGIKRMWVQRHHADDESGGG